MKPRLVVRDADLEIRPMPQKRVPSPQAIERTIASMGFQTGAAYVRALKPCLRPAQCTDHGLGPEQCQLCNPQNAPWRQGAR